MFSMSSVLDDAKDGTNRGNSLLVEEMLNYANWHLLAVFLCVIHTGTIFSKLSCVDQSRCCVIPEDFPLYLRRCKSFNDGISEGVRLFSGIAKMP